MASVEKYDPEKDIWTVVPDMYNPRSNFAVEVIDDMIFCIGGSYANDIWIFAPFFPYLYYTISLAVTGFNGATTIYHVECYDDKTTEWFEATDMNIYRSALSACVVTDLPNIADYIHQHRDRLMEERRQRLFSVNQLTAAARAAS
jgi:kelch-like protein 10